MSFMIFQVPDSLQFMRLLPCCFILQDSLVSWYQQRDEYVLAAWLDSACTVLRCVAQSTPWFAST